MWLSGKFNSCRRLHAWAWCRHLATMRRTAPVVFRVTFVRHGETALNKEHRIQGGLDIPLNTIGEKQAMLAGQVVAQQVFSRAYASDLRRAFRTCELILQTNHADTPTIVADQRLRERNFGCIESLHIDEVKAMAAADGASWPTWTPQGAETTGEVQARVVAFFKEMCQSVYDKNKKEVSGEEEDAEEADEGQDVSEEEASESVLVVSHGIALKQLFLHIHRTLGCPAPPDPDALTRISPNTGISQYLVQYSPKKYKIRCLDFHNGEHLNKVTEDV